MDNEHDSIASLNFNFGTASEFTSYDEGTRKLKFIPKIKPNLNSPLNQEYEITINVRDENTESSIRSRSYKLKLVVVQPWAPSPPKKYLSEDAIFFENGTVYNFSAPLGERFRHTNATEVIPEIIDVGNDGLITVIFNKGSERIISMVKIKHLSLTIPTRDKRSEVKFTIKEKNPILRELKIQALIGDPTVISMLSDDKLLITIKEPILDTRDRNNTYYVKDQVLPPVTL
jgi:hypothetical protein